MQTVINALLLVAVVVLIVRQQMLKRAVDKLRSNSGSAFAAVTRHFQKGARE